VGTEEAELIHSVTQGASIALDAGTWNFTVKGYNGDGALILEGKLTGQTISLSSNSLTFSLAPLLGGTGSIAITITLPSGSGITTAAVFREGEEQSPALLLTGNQITYSAADVNAGDYFYSFRLKDSAGNTLAVVSENVQVRADLPSEKTITLTQANLNTLPVMSSAPLIVAGDRQLRVSWTAVEMVGDYEVYWGTDSTPSGTPQSVSNTTTTVISGLDNGTTYNVWVEALNAAGSSGLSPVASGKPLGAMGTVRVTPSGGALTLDWDAVAGADEYEVYYSTDDNRPDSPAQTVNGTSATINGLIAGTTYHVWVRGKNPSGTGGFSPAASGTPGQRVAIAITVHPLVEWDVLAQTATVKQNTTAQFAVTGTYDSYKWYLDGALTATTASTYTFDATGKAAGDVFELVVVVENSQGERRSGRVRITVTAPDLGAPTPKAFADALTTIQSSDEAAFAITLGADISLAPQTLSSALYSGKTITLKGDSNVRTISLSSQGSLFTVGEDVTLALDNNITLEGRTDNNAPLVKVNLGGALMVNAGGTISGNTNNSSDGGGVYCDGGTVEINGGSVSNNRVAGVSGIKGGGIAVANNSVLRLNSGAIIDNVSSVSGPGDLNCMGGGIGILSGSVFEMSGGVISGNTVTSVATSNGTRPIGGGVLIYTNSHFEMSGGVIRDNHVSASGANSWVTAEGGGVAIFDGSSFEMSGGVINGNTCTSSVGNTLIGRYKVGAYGGGVTVGSTQADSFIKSGGIIYGNEASGTDADGIPLKNTVGTNGGHAVFVDSPSASTMLRRNSTAGQEVALDTATAGSAGGWE
jgi:hypothetical protein